MFENIILYEDGHWELCTDFNVYYTGCTGETESHFYYNIVVVVFYEKYFNATRQYDEVNLHNDNTWSYYTDLVEINLPSRKELTLYKLKNDTSNVKRKSTLIHYVNDLHIMTNFAKRDIKEFEIRNYAFYDSVGDPVNGTLSKKAT